MATWLTEDETLHEDHDRALRIVARLQASPAFIRQLEDTEFGTAGLRYRRLALPEQIARLPNAVFLELEREHKLVGTYAVAARELHTPDGPAKGLYRGLLTLSRDARREGLGRYLVERTFDWLERRSAVGPAPVISWGCIERNNLRSLSLLQTMGASTLGTLQSMLTYRQWPRSRVTVDELGETDTRAVIKSALETSYRDCGLRAADTTTERYLAVTDESGVVAGARATLTRLNMVSSGSRWDFFYAGLMRHVPAARRRFDPRNFTYVRLSDVVVRPGRERLWRDLLPTIMARHDAHMAMFMLDPRSKVYTRLAEAGLFGRFAAATRQEILVLAQAWNAPGDFLARSARQPLAIGPLDI